MKTALSRQVSNAQEIRTDLQQDRLLLDLAKSIVFESHWAITADQTRSTLSQSDLKQCLSESFPNASINDSFKRAETHLKGAVSYKYKK